LIGGGEKIDTQKKRKKRSAVGEPDATKVVKRREQMRKEKGGGSGPAGNRKSQTEKIMRQRSCSDGAEGGRFKENPPKNGPKNSAPN